MKKMIALALSAVMALSPIAGGDKGNPADDTKIVGDDSATWEPAICFDQETDIEIPDPFFECSSLGEAAENTGFPFSVPEAIDGYAQRMIRTMGDEESGAMIEVIYRNETDGNERTVNTDEIRMRKANFQYMKTVPVLKNGSHEKAWLLRVAANLSKNRIKYNFFRKTDELDETI